MVRKTLLAILCLITVGCSEGQTTAVSNQVSVSAEGYDLVFFLNPDGAPCLMQGRILDGMRSELQGKVTIRYVRTSVADDLPLFGRYGIRGLPSLLLADASGKEIKRLPPGVKSVEEIRALIQAVQ